VIVFSWPCNDFSLLVLLLQSLNVALAPKVQCPEEISQVRPIGLCNFFYNIVFKVMVNRMRRVMDSVISAGCFYLGKAHRR